MNFQQPLDYAAPMSRKSAISLFRWIRNLFIVLGGFVVLLVILAAILIRPEAQRLQRAVQMAEAHAFIVRTALAADDRFQSVEVHAASNGKLVISGELKDDNEATDLKGIVRKTAPPVPLSWSTMIRTPASQPSTRSMTDLD